ncbi:MAG: hypothetical protein SGPRY_000210 [Prymnesium sp.]
MAAAKGMAVALSGSSGGSTFRGEARSECAALSEQLRSLHASLAFVAYVQADLPLDHASPSSEASLWEVWEEGEENRGGEKVGQDGSCSVDGPRCTAHGSLSHINCLARAADVRLAEAILRGKIDALVLLSADVRPPDGTSARALAAAVAAGVPVLGTGGCCLGLAARSGASLLQLSGSVGTSAHSRAIAIGAALGRHAGVSFELRLPPSEAGLSALLPTLDQACAPPAWVATGSNPFDSSGLSPCSAHSPSVALAPAALAQALPALLLCSLLRSVGAPEPTASLLSNILIPTSLGALAAARAAGRGQRGELAGLLAGGITATVAMSLGGEEGSGRSGCGLAALLAGQAAGLASRSFVALCHARGLPATASTLLACGGPALVGGICGAVCVPINLCLGEWGRWLLYFSCNGTKGILMGAVLGCATKQLSFKVRAYIQRPAPAISTYYHPPGLHPPRLICPIPPTTALHLCTSPAAPLL